MLKNDVIFLVTIVREADPAAVLTFHCVTSTSWLFLPDSQRKHQIILFDFTWLKWPQQNCFLISNNHCVLVNLEPKTDTDRLVWLLLERKQTWQLKQQRWCLNWPRVCRGWCHWWLETWDINDGLQWWGRLKSLSDKLSNYIFPVSMKLYVTVILVVRRESIHKRNEVVLTQSSFSFAETLS